ncbi:MAG: TolC family protein [Pedosphaera sp.]|nr:TolC family protein [Pedosphaera sp.]
MKRTMIRSLTLMSALGCAALSARAAVAPGAITNVVTIEILVAEALENNPELKFYRAEIAAAKAGRKTAGLLPNPEVSTQLRQKRAYDTSRTLTGEGAGWAVSVSQTFEWPGRLGLRKSIANQEIELAELGLARFQSALGGRMRELGHRHVSAQRKAAASREVADRFQTLLGILVQRDPAGLTPVLETRIIEANTLTYQRRAGAAVQEAQEALLELNQLRGQPVQAQVEILVAPVDLRPPEPIEFLLSRARTNNFELRLRQAELVQQGFKISLARNERYPAITAGPFFSSEKAGDREKSVGIALSFPLPLWKGNQSSIEIAEARRVQAEASFAAALREVERKVVSAALAYRVKLAEMERWRLDAVEKFREAAELADRHYRLGAVPVATYVELQRQYLDAVEALLATKEEALEAAEQLELLAGPALSPIPLP